MKRLLLPLLLTALLLSVSVTAKSIAKETLDTNTAYMGGYEDNTFRPDNTITRAEAVTVIARLLVGEDAISDGVSAFRDVSDHWSRKYIVCLEKKGFLSSYGSEFFPDKPITRAEFVELAVLSCHLRETGEEVSFKDVPETHPFYDAIIKLANAGLVGGYEDNTFRPDNTITRAEVVTVINRAQGIDTTTNVFGQNYTKLRGFNDIATHWARYNILVASNSGVGKYVTPVYGSEYIGGIFKMNDSIRLENGYFAYIIACDGSVEDIVDKESGESIMGEPVPFAYLTVGDTLIYPESAGLDNGKIYFTMENGDTFTVIPTVKDCYISFEIADYNGNAKSLSFAQTKLDYETESDDDLCVLGVSMCSKALTQNQPKISTRNYMATAFGEFGINGAKYAIIATPIKYHLTALEALAKDTDIREGIFSASRFDSETERLVNTNYFICHNSNHKTLFDNMDLYVSVGVDMLAFHQGGGTFRQGDFNFVYQSLKSAYINVLSSYVDSADRRDYSYYMTPEGARLLPIEHSKEFEYLGSYKLQENIKKSTREIKLENCTLTGIYYVAIGDELIKATFENGVTTEVTRGASDTERFTHDKGSEAVVIDITGSGAFNFKALVSDKLREYGILSGLHTYAFYINEGCEELLSDPKWQEQFEITEEYTLAEDITASTRRIKTVESLDGASKGTGWLHRAWDLVIIDGELIRINVGTFNDNTITAVERGRFDTVATEHKAGAKIKRIGSYYGGLTPEIGSDLYYYVGQLTGEAYTNGGFDMVYFDAIDGVRKHIPTGSEFGGYQYHTTEFLRETLEHCATKPITEVYNPSQYVVHSYTPAYDYANRGYKEYMRYHSEFNKTYLNSYFFATMGWYNFYPQKDIANIVDDPLKYPANTVYEYQHTDDVDLLGTLGIAYDYSMVFANLETYYTLPKNKSNIDRYVKYDKLRKEGYFSEEIKKQLRESSYEHALVDKGNGNWALVQKHYDDARVHNLSDSYFNYIEGNNPFDEQTPFIRIQTDWSSVGEAPVLLAEFDENSPLTSQTLSYEYGETVNADQQHALRVRVKGNGKGGAICFCLESPKVSDDNQIDYVIPLDFDGWKEFTLVATDSFLYPANYFPHWSGRNTYNFKVYRGPVDFSAISKMRIFTYGNVDGVMIDDVVLAKHTFAPMVNPTVTLDNGDTITFKCTVNSSEYLEYDGKSAVIFDALGNTREVDEITGSITVDSGSYKATLTADSAVDGAILRGKLTFGFTGEELE
ncbi:MAG: S-layer homology domain-containing protein [Clostridia bacterium]|nr:S-layer homology domain-containing protein [Clostridia bacterium]